MSLLRAGINPASTLQISSIGFPFTSPLGGREICLREKINSAFYEFIKINKHALWCPTAAFEPRGLLTAAGRGLFVPDCSGERVRGDGQGLGAGGGSVDAPHRAVAVSWPGESRDCCCGCRTSCCCGSPTGSCAHRCSSCRRGLRGSRLLLPLAD